MVDVADSLNGDMLGGGTTPSPRTPPPLIPRPHITDAALEATYGFSFGELNGLGYLTKNFGEQSVHTWDIAKGSNQQADLNGELVNIATPVFEELVAFVGQGSVYGNKKELAAGASPLLALLGRSED